MKLRLILAALVLLLSRPVYATTFALSSAVTGSTNPASTAIDFFISPNHVFEVMGVIPVVSTVTGAPASMAASVNVGTGGVFNSCGSGTPVCNSDLWAAQWTVVSAPTGVQAVNAYQGATVRLVNTSGNSAPVTFRCQVGQMTGSCIFVIRVQAFTEPLF
ncbi:MAG: hypothetical protein ABI682_01870 [Acidobacteriota bacterium]